jgi:hypothetical protein
MGVGLVPRLGRRKKLAGRKKEEIGSPSYKGRENLFLLFFFVFSQSVPK